MVDVKSAGRIRSASSESFASPSLGEAGGERSTTLVTFPDPGALDLDDSTLFRLAGGGTRYFPVGTFGGCNSGVAGMGADHAPPPMIVSSSSVSSPMAVPPGVKLLIPPPTGRRVDGFGVLEERPRPAKSNDLRLREEGAPL